jgi:hypothetical protein
MLDIKSDVDNEREQEFIARSQQHSETFTFAKTPKKDGREVAKPVCPRAPLIDRHIELIDLRSSSFGPLPEKLIFPEF